MSNASIRRRIRQKKREIRICERVITKVSREIGKLDDQLAVWTRQQGLLNGEEPTALVVARNQYEGTTAMKNHQQFYESLDCKRRKEMEINDMVDRSHDLKRNIRTRIEELQDEIDYLYSCLDDD